MEQIAKDLSQRTGFTHYPVRWNNPYTGHYETGIQFRDARGSVYGYTKSNTAVCFFSPRAFSASTQQELLPSRRPWPTVRQGEPLPSSRPRAKQIVVAKHR